MNEDQKFITEKIEEAPAVLPEALQEENIVAAVQEVTPAKPKNHRYRTVFISLAAALVIVIGIAVAIRFGGGRPGTVRYDDNAHSAAPVEIKDYSEIAKILAKNLKEREKSSRGGWLFGGLKNESYGMNADMEMAQNAAVDDSAAPNATEEESVNKGYSQLNTRTEGVDETDTVRTDGSCIYVLSANRYYGYFGYYGYYRHYWINEAAQDEADPQTFTVVDPNGGKMQVLSETDVTAAKTGEENERSYRSFNGFYLYGNYAVLTGSETTYRTFEIEENEKASPDDTVTVEEAEDVSPEDPAEAAPDIAVDYGYYPYYPYSEPESRGLVCVYDISDPANVTLAKELWFDSSILDTRIADGKLITVSTFYPYTRDFVKNDYTTFIPCAGEDYVAPEDIVVADEEGEVFFTVTETELSGDFACESASVLGTAHDFYCSGKNVYAYASDSTYKGPAKGWVSELKIYKISLEGGKPAYQAQVKFEEAWLRDDYSIDEYNGTLRVALECWNEPVSRNENYLVILDGNMNVLSQTECFGESETIESVRFSGDLCYVVTFYQTDPLFVFDLSDPANPVKRGELKLPGYSAYLHPAGEGYMIGVGVGGTDEGLDGSAKISLFSVADPENPVEVSQLTLAEGWFDSDHKAFITRGENGFIVTFTRWSDDNYSCGALYFTVEDGKLVEQSRCLLPFDNVSGHKALFIGSELYLYAMWSDYSAKDGAYQNGERICAFNIDSGEMISSLDF